MWGVSETKEQFIRRDATLLQVLGVRTGCLEPRGPVQCSLGCS